MSGNQSKEAKMEFPTDRTGDEATAEFAAGVLASIERPETDGVTKITERLM